MMRKKDQICEKKLIRLSSATSAQNIHKGTQCTALLYAYKIQKERTYGV